MIEKNDVVVIIRPKLDSKGNYDGDFSIIHSISGPITIDPADMHDVASVGLIMALMLLWMEENEEVAEYFEDYVEKNHLDKFEELAVAIATGESTVNLSGTVH
jgi:hypothetical protein